MWNVLQPGLIIVAINALMLAYCCFVANILNTRWWDPTSWATTVLIDWAESQDSHGRLRYDSHLPYSVQSIHTVVTHDVLFFIFFGTV